MIREALEKVVHEVRRCIYRPDVRVTARLETVYLGTTYGGWSFLDDPSLHGATVVSCGLGEDASFDVAFARRFDAKVLIVDPTPRAIEHARGILDRIGQPRQRDYVRGGKQPLDAYDLTGLSPEQLTVIPKALWIRNGKIKFFHPKDPEHVSHSIINYQNEYSAETAYTEVETITIEEIMKGWKLDSLPLVKLDIEGAEVDVILDMMTKRIHPLQILVEFDELNVPSRRAKNRFETAKDRLLSDGYQLVFFDGRADFLFARR